VFNKIYLLSSCDIVNSLRFADHNLGTPSCALVWFEMMY